MLRRPQFVWFCCYNAIGSRSQWPRGLRRRSAAPRWLILWFRIPLGARKFVCCECCVLSGRGLWDELITRREEPYRLLCVVVCDLETSPMRRPCPVLGRSATGKRTNKIRKMIIKATFFSLPMSSRYFTKRRLFRCFSVKDTTLYPYPSSPAVLPVRWLPARAQCCRLCSFGFLNFFELRFNHTITAKSRIPAQHLITFCAQRFRASCFSVRLL
jgi:hypothetical protein